MPKSHETDFHEYFEIANFTDDEAAESLSAGGEVVSMVVRHSTPELFVVAFATRQGRAGPFALNRMVATQLRELLQQHGF